MENNKSNTFVSVLMSVYNEESRFLEEAIESILNQTYKNFEFIIIGDNPSNERVNNLVSDYQKKDSRIIFKINETNLGLTRSLNVGLKLCRGKYVVRMDADDVSMPTRIEEQVAYMEAHPSITAATTFAIGIDECGREIRKIEKTTDVNRIKRDLLFSCPLIHPSAIIRNEWPNKWRFEYDETFRYAQDYALWVSVFKSGGQVFTLNKHLLKYRYSQTQIHSSHREEQNDCALRASHNALAMMNISITDTELPLWDHLRCSQSIDEDVQAKYFDFICSFNKKNKHIDSLDLNSITEILIFNYLKGLDISHLTKYKLYYRLLYKTNMLSLKEIIKALLL